MNLLERVLTLLRANLNTMAEKSDDPEKTLRQLQQDMRNQLVQVKTQVATAISEEMKLQKRSQEFQNEADSWHKKAEQAVQLNNEHAARDYLARYNDLARQAQRYGQQRKEQEQLVTTMRGILRQLEAKISEVDTTIELLTARKRSALLQQRVYDTLSKSGSPKDKERALRAQDKLLEVEARARALADLEQRDPDSQLARISQEQIIEDQLQQLKQKQLPKSGKPLQLDSQATTGKKRPANLPTTGELTPISPDELTGLDIEQDAMDASQEALIRIYTKIQSYEEKALFKTWVQRIVTNICIDKFRKNKPTVSIEEHEMTFVASKNVEDEVLSADLSQAIREAIELLPEHHRTVVILRYLHDFSYNEIADSLHLPLNTVKSYLFRARQQLQTLLRDYEKGGVRG